MPHLHSEDQYKMKKNMRLVHPNLPRIEEFKKHLSDIWDSANLSNFGKYESLFRLGVKKYLKLENVVTASSGTVALTITLRALGTGKKILSSPFSFPATIQAAILNGSDVDFADIDPNTGNVSIDSLLKFDISKYDILLFPHVYSIPCNIQRICELTQGTSIFTVYDAAHGFGTQVNNKHLSSFGDISTLSFHATKILNSGEGGAILTSNHNLARKCQAISNFGLDSGDSQDMAVGLNGKMSELHALLGYMNLKIIDRVIQKRRSLYHRYIRNLAEFDLGYILKPNDDSNVKMNGAYMPIYFYDKDSLLLAERRLKDENVETRRYFDYRIDRAYAFFSGRRNPLALPIFENMVGNVLCVPTHSKISSRDVDRVCEVLVKK